jgi:hypothetical protein
LKEGSSSSPGSFLIWSSALQALAAIRESVNRAKSLIVVFKMEKRMALEKRPEENRRGSATTLLERS